MIQINSIAELGRSLSVKREKGEDDVEVVTAKVQLTGLYIDRYVMDEILGKPVGWSTMHLYDDLGAPTVAVALDLLRAEWTVTGGITGASAVNGAETKAARLSVSQGTLHGVALTLDALGAKLSGSLSWKARGDEVEDLSDLLGRTVRVDVGLDNGGQRDMFAGVQNAVDKLRRMADAEGIDSVSISVGGKTVFSHEKPVQIQKVAELIELLGDGWKLYCTGPAQYRLRKEGERERHIWVNAVTALTRRRTLIEGEGGELLDAGKAA